MNMFYKKTSAPNFFNFKRKSSIIRLLSKQYRRIFVEL
jgi:hypothetical protein